MARRRWIEVAAIAVSGLAAGCGTGLPVASDNEPSMRDILERHALASQPPHTVPPRSAVRAASPFPLLDNPMLLLWVHPHFSAGPEPLPVPGYVTALPLYARDHFALPGESALP